MTIKDIARESGYAVGTVSRVLNNHPGVSDEARKRVMEVVEKYHFRLNSNAKHLKQQANSGIAIIVKGKNNMLFAGLVESLQKMIKARGFASVLYYITEDDHEVEQAMQICRERQPMGILFLGSNKENFQQRFASVEIPCVRVTNSAIDLDFENLSSVCIDDVSAGQVAVEHLLKLGHQEIGIIAGDMSSSNPASDRFKGCMQAFQQYQVDFEPRLQVEETNFTFEGGYLAMKRLLVKKPDLTAVFAMSDVTAMGAIRAAKDFGKDVPGDISVVGFDGIEMGQYMVPNLTTIQQPSDKIASRCVDILLECITENSPSVREIIPFTLIKGESTQRLSTEE